MGDGFEDAAGFLAKCSAEEQRRVLAWLRERHPIHAIEKEFGAPAELILEAISRSPDLSKRGVLGLIAEASFQVNVIEKLTAWKPEPVTGHHAFDVQLRQGDRVVTIQVKRQRRDDGQPMRYPRSYLYAVETQRTRGGTDRKTKSKTRYYRFGDFDILAVSMQPAANDWACFRYTVQRWLLPHEEDSSWLKVIQPLSLEPNADWTDRIEEAIDWHFNGGDRRISAGEPTSKRKDRGRAQAPPEPA